MAKGGKRQGAGRPKGSINRSTAELRAAIAASGEEMPIDYMLRVMHDTKADSERRDDMAKAAAPYLHPRLTSTEVTGKDGGPIQTANIDLTKLSREDLDALDDIARRASGVDSGPSTAATGKSVH